MICLFFVVDVLVMNAYCILHGSTTQVMIGAKSECEVRTCICSGFSGGRPVTLLYETDVGQDRAHDASPGHLAPGGTCLALSAATSIPSFYDMY